MLGGVRSGVATHLRWRMLLVVMLKRHFPLHGGQEQPARDCSLRQAVGHHVASVRPDERGDDPLGQELS